MFSRINKRIAITTLTAVVALVPATGIVMAQKKGATAAKKETVKKSATTTKKASVKKSGTSRKPAAAPKKESVNDVKKQQGAVQQEIASTRAKIKENEQAVKKGLADLNVLQGEIAEGKKKLDDASRQVNELTQKISTVEQDISKEEGELRRLREEYLKAVKKMRVKRKSASTLSFIFSSKSFSEAMRRMRYLREFSAWRDRQSDIIGDKVVKLKSQKELLAKTKTEKDAALTEQNRLQSKLQTQYKEQDAVVVKLKANGDALRTYLAQKQSEANVLKGRVAALIAEEQRKAEAERKAREEAAALKEKQRKEQLARAEAEKKAAEAKAAKEREIAAAEAKAKADAAAKDKAKQEKPKQDKPKKENKKPEKKNEVAKKEETKNESSKTYAEARQRRPRGDNATSSENLSKPSAPANNTKAAGGDFAQMKGSLPRPVAGSFRITSQFGRHALPDLPNVMYDNPGIDAEVAAGASAQAVFGGKVSGVYVVPGYSTVVIVNHGNYYTVYGNIQNAAVKVGDTVKQGQNLGKLAPSDDDPSHSSIHFEVWHNRDKMNPTQWIR